MLFFLCVSTLMFAAAAGSGVSLREQQSAIGFALAPNISLWEQLLLPTPTIVTLMGKMVVLSTEVDVSLAATPPKGGFQLVRHPSSLRASLVQVSNDGYDAFSTAHTKMDEISLTMVQVPRFVKMAMRIIKKAPARRLVQMLNVPLTHIQKAGEKAVRLSAETEKAFVDVMGLTAELSESVASSQGDHDIKIMENQAKYEAGKTQRELMREQEAKMEAHYQKQAAYVEKARRNYEKAIRDIPTGFKAMVMGIVQQVVPALVGGLTGGISLFTGGGGGGSAGSIQGGGSRPINTTNNHDPVILATMSKLAESLPQITAAVRAFKNNDTREKDLYTAIKKAVEMSLQNFDRFPASGIKDTAFKALNNLDKIVDYMGDLVGDLGSTFTDEIFGSVLEGIDGVANTIQSLVAAGVQSGSTMGMSVSGAADFGKGVGANERFIAYNQMQVLENAEDRLDSLYRDLQEYNSDLIELEKELKLLDLQNINLKTIRVLLGKVLGLLGHIRELWSKLVMFFSQVAVRARVINESYLQSFISLTSESGSLLGAEDSAGMRDMLVEMLRDQALDIQVVSYYLHMLTGTYVRVSSEHILSRLAGLSKLLAAENDTDRREFFDQLDQDNEAARTDIMALIEDTRETYKSEMAARRQRMQDTIDNLGGLTSAEIENMEDGQGLLEGNAVDDDPWSLPAF